MSRFCCWRRGPRAFGHSVASGAPQPSGESSPSRCRDSAIPMAAGADRSGRLRERSGPSDRRMGLGSPHVVGPDVERRPSSRRSPGRVTSLTIGGGAVPSRSKRAARSRTSSKRRVWTSSGDWTPDQHRLRRRGRCRERQRASPRGLRQRLTWGASRSRPGSCGITPSRTGVARSAPAITTPLIVAGRDDDLVRGRTTIPPRASTG
jgi:hypothetical protein